jgi:septal ring factor EnvC (AmiA/AmiB activator)
VLTASPSSDSCRIAADCPRLKPSIPRVVLVLAAVILPSWPPFAAEAPSSEAAAALEREIAVLQAELDSLSRERSTQARELGMLEAKEALARRRLVRSGWERDAVARQVADEERLSVELARATELGKRRAAAALREVYKESALSGYASLLSVSDPADLLRGFQSLAVVARRQGEAIGSFEARRVEAEQSAERLRLRRSDLESAVAGAVREREALAEERAARLSYVERLEEDRSANEEAVAELTRAASDLAAAIASLPAGATPPRVSVSLTRLKGTLPWPAEGPVIAPFGTVRHPRFATVTPHPGIEIQVKPGASVRAVGSGRVVFNRRYGSYGRTVVIDHGDRYLSVYAHLAGSVVDESDDVVPGQPIGFAPEADAGGSSSVYFEMRLQGKAVDPLSWLRRVKESGARD